MNTLTEEIARAAKKALRGFDNEHHHICPDCAEHARCNRVDCGGYVKRCENCGNKITVDYQMPE